MLTRFCAGWIFLLLLSTLLAGGCARLPGSQVADAVTPLVMEREPDPAELLDVSIKIFDPGELPEDPDKRQGLSPEIRDAEARFFPVHLKYTMQESGYWGAVRVVPDDDVGAEILVKGKILYSDGESLSLAIEAFDATGRRWFAKEYAETASPMERDRARPAEQDIFQDLFTTIANELARYRAALPAERVKEIREVAMMRYARAMAPDAFAGYLGQDAEGHFKLLRLPAEDDPMLDRVRKLRARDDMLVDVINGYYNGYYQELWEPYTNWRRFRGEEVAAMRKLERQALTRQVLGVAAIVGAIAIGALGDNDVLNRTGTLRDVMVIGGGAALYSGFQKRHETEINKEAIEELDSSFKAEAEPLVVEINGETIRLTGSAEQQYTRWRQLLREMYLRETGLPAGNRNEARHDNAVDEATGSAEGTHHEQ